MLRGQDERTVITRSFIGKKLKRDARSGTVAVTLFTLLCLLCLWVLYLIESTVFVTVLLSLAGGGLLLVWGQIVLSCVITYRRVNRGDYSVSESTLLEVGPRLKPRNRRTRHAAYEFVFTFADGRIYTVGDHTNNETRLEYSANFSKKGDLFYLVTYNKRPEHPILIYHASLYRYEDR